MLYFKHSCLEETLNVINIYTFGHSKWAYAVLILHCHGRFTEIMKRCRLRNKLKIIHVAVCDCDSSCVDCLPAWPPYLATASAWCAWTSIDLSTPAPVSSLPLLTGVPQARVWVKLNPSSASCS